MTAAEAIRELSTATNNLPEASLRWSLEHWDEAGPECLRLLEMAASSQNSSTESLDAVFFVVHLCAEMREPRAFPLICRLLGQRGIAEEILDDAGILISTWNGDDRPLKRVIESHTADEFARGDAMDAYAYIARSNNFSDAETRAFWAHLRARMRPRGENHVWAAWAITASNLGYEDLAGEVEDLIGRGRIPFREISVEDFRDQARIAKADPTGMAGFERDCIRPFTNTIGTLSRWYGFSEVYRRDAARTEIGKIVTPEQHISDILSRQQAESPFLERRSSPGRNDPCPCGSGKKYKRCCLSQSS